MPVFGSRFSGARFDASRSRPDVTSDMRVMLCVADVMAVVKKPKRNKVVGIADGYVYEVLIRDLLWKTMSETEDGFHREITRFCFMRDVDDPHKDDRGRQS